MMLDRIGSREVVLVAVVRGLVLEMRRCLDLAGYGKVTSLA
jgi:hypothetical protein